MPAEHLRIMDNGYIGLYQGGYCPNCGEGGINMLGSGHCNLMYPHNDKPAWFCAKNSALVAELREINRFGEEMVGLHYSDLIDIYP